MLHTALLSTSGWYFFLCRFPSLSPETAPCLFFGWHCIGVCLKHLLPVRSAITTVQQLLLVWSHVLGMICLERQWEIEWSWKKNKSYQEMEKMNYELRPREKINMHGMAKYVYGWRRGNTVVSIKKKKEKLSSTRLRNSNNNGKKRRKHIGIKWHILDRGIAF